MVDFPEEIENQICTNFKVTKIPVWALKEFKKLCKEEYGDIYSVGIIQLMKIKKMYGNLIPILSQLQEQINPLKTPTTKTELKTFGA